MADSLDFKIENSPLASYLASLTQDQLYARYFKQYFGKPDDKEKLDSYLDEINREMDMYDSNGNAVYGYLDSLLGEKLNSIITRIFKSVSVYLPNDCTLNAKAVMQDLETFLSENKPQALKAAQNAVLTPFVKQFVNFTVKNLSSGLEVKLKLTT